MPQDDTFYGWTIYNHPSDFPQHIVARQWMVDELGQILYNRTPILCQTVEEAREHVPAGAICFPREPEDDPVILETWI